MDDRINRFDKALPKVERKLYAEIQIALKGLDLDDAGNIKKTTANLYRIQVIRNKMERIMQSPEYIQEVVLFSNSIKDITKLSEAYINTLSAYKTTKFLNELQKVSIQETRLSLGMASKTTKNPEFTQRVVMRAMDIVELNVKNGSKFIELNEQVRDFIIQDKDGKGALQRYSRQITTDSLNQYAATYLKTAASDLGLEWFRYVNPLVKDSRDWCVYMVKKQWVHESELDDLPTAFNIPINKKTGLPYGMIAGTNGTNILQRRGGWNCNHQMVPVLEEAVPVKIRSKIGENISKVPN